MTRRCTILSLVAVVLCSFAPVDSAGAAEVRRFSEAEAAQTKDAEAAANTFSSGVLTVLIPLSASSGQAKEIRCAVFGALKGVKSDVRFRIHDAERNLLSDTTETKRTKKDGWTKPIVVPPLLGAAPANSVLTATADPVNKKKTDEIRLRCIYGFGDLCNGSSDPACS